MFYCSIPNVLNWIVNEHFLTSEKEYFNLIRAACDRWTVRR